MIKTGLLILSVLFMATAHGAGLPELGDSSRNSFSTATEARIGQEIMGQIRASPEYAEDPVIVDYLNTLGERLANSSESSQAFEFFLIQDRSVNAFALPGGYIGVHTGLVLTTQTESELASVLAHEIAHVTQNHIARIMDARRSSSMASLVSIAVAILAARSDPTVAQAAIVGAQAIGIQNQLDFTREHEREADRVGLQTLSAAGFTPQGMGAFFERLQAKNRVYETNAPAYLRTHPLTHERLADIQNRLSSLPYRQTVDSPEYELVRARVTAEDGEASDAVAIFLEKTKRATQTPASWYGLALAYIRAGNTVQAELALKKARSLADESPILSLAEIELAMATAQNEKALRLSTIALFSHSGYRPLSYAHARALLSNGHGLKALTFLDEQRRTWTTDSTFPALKAEALQKLGRPVESALSQADAYELRGQLGSAVTQLEMAQKLKGADFRTMSQVDARLRLLRDKAENQSN